MDATVMICMFDIFHSKENECFSFSLSLRLAEDILDFDPSIEPLTLTKGSNIRVKWTDGAIYSCKYIGRKRVLLYHIQFDNETRQMRRHEFVCEYQSVVPSSLKSNQSENEHNYSRRQPVTKRSKRNKAKRKRKRVSSTSIAAEGIHE